MPEPLKNIYTTEFIRKLASELKKSYAKFDSRKFESHIFDSQWSELELKQRMRHIAQSFKIFVPKNYADSIEIFKPVATKFGGFESMFFPDYVELYGMDEYDVSIDALAHFTQYSSSEFAVRPFIIKHPKKMMKQMVSWAKSDNYHIRRLASEGCRPRLPWAMALPEFKKDPEPVLSVISKLKKDSSEYVRRSVANNLNDISKDHPERVIEISKKWIGKTADTDWIVKHACRTLLKAGNPEALQIFGYSHPKHIFVERLTADSEVKWGESLPFSFSLKSKKGALNKLRVEYAIYFMKANKKQAKKVFKISEGVYSESEKEISRFYSFRAISTRKYYPGLHSVSIIANGVELAKCDFLLLE